MSCSLKSVLAEVQRTTVSVNGVVIPHDIVAREVQHHPESTPVRAWQQAARALAVRELLLQEARRQDLKAEPQTDGDGRRETDEEALIRGLIAREVRVPEPDEDACRRYYDHNRSRFRSADLYEASHILIAARRDQPEAFAAARDRVEAAARDARERARPLCRPGGRALRLSLCYCRRQPWPAHQGRHHA